MEDASEEGLYYCGTFKSDHKLFFLPTLEILMNELMVDSYLVMNSNTVVLGDISYMYIDKK